jgi:arsenate reductase
MIKIYGIKNCDTMKKAFKWLNDHDVTYDVHDYKKMGVDSDALSRAMDVHGWESVINQRGSTWRQIPETERQSMNREQAEILAHAKPSVIKRPLITQGDSIILGFDMDKYEQSFIK